MEEKLGALPQEGLCRDKHISRGKSESTKGDHVDVKPTRDLVVGWIYQPLKITPVGNNVRNLSVVLPKCMLYKRRSYTGSMMFVPARMIFMAKTLTRCSFCLLRILVSETLRHPQWLSSYHKNHEMIFKPVRSECSVH